MWETLRSTLAPSFHPPQQPVLSCCLSEGAGLDRTLERRFLLLLTQLEALALSNPGHTFPPNPNTLPAHVLAGTWPQYSPATGPTAPEAGPSRSRSSSAESLPGLQSWGCKSSSCSSTKAIKPLTLGLDPMPSACWSGARHGASWKRELPLD